MAYIEIEGAAPTTTSAIPQGLVFERYFSTKTHPFDEIEWEIRTASISGESGTVFEQTGVEVPKSWSQLATNVVASKYFRGQLGTPEREYSVKQLISRVVNTIVRWGKEGGYFASDTDAQVFGDEITCLALSQTEAWNSPVWFNIGVLGRKQQSSACFILSVEDSMDSILDWYKQEGTIFKWGSGSGCSLSKVRSAGEPLTGGGTASGVLSFMKAADASAGVIKSAGAVRRAAKMVVLDVSHPDVFDFIECKVKEEKKAHVLIDAGYDSAIDGEAYTSVSFQNANNSVRVTDAFMHAVERDEEWSTKYITTGKVHKTVNAKELLRKIAQATWESGDPGIQFDTTINNWHTCPNTGRINASNPCCLVGETLVSTLSGNISFADLMNMHVKGEPLPLTFSWDATQRRIVAKEILKVWVAGETKNLIEVKLECFTLRCTPEHRFLLHNGEYVEAQYLTRSHILQGVQEAKEFIYGITPIVLDVPIPVYDMEVDGTHNFVVTSSLGDGSIFVHNSEYMHIDDSACNLASLNLLKFLKDGEFDIESFTQAVRLTITSQEILVSQSDFPTEQIGKNARAYRQLGLGYANLGALLMSMGFPYDSDTGRNIAAGITALMTGEAYAQSARIAAQVGPFEGYEKNKEPMLSVIVNHHNASHKIPTNQFNYDLVKAAQSSWKEALHLGQKHGYRNSQATVLAPCGTIGFMMDCDTTGIEPAFALVAHKKLVGGGVLKIANNSVEQALQSLQYNKPQRDVILAYVLQNGNVEGCSVLKPEHLPVFDCAVTVGNGTRSISWEGHVKMMGAVQPFLSGAISKTVNAPSSATVDDIMNIYTESWKLGLKAVAIYRDGCKRSQPLNTKKPAMIAASVDTPTATPPARRRLPSERKSLCHKFAIAGHEGYIHAGMYENGELGEVFVRMAKEGSTVSGLMDTIATLTSLSLQYGVPLSTMVEKFSHVRYEPSGFTGNADIPYAKSLTDYLFRFLGQRFLGQSKAVTQGDGVQHHPVPSLDKMNDQADAPLCSNCGDIMRRAGSCFVCGTCATTSGCS